MATSPPPPRSTVTPSVWTDLPPELLPAIFEDLQDGALRSCALVRRQWRWPAQRRLFHRVHVNRHEHFLALTETLRASPHLRPFVKILELSINSSSASAADRANGLFPAVEELRDRTASRHRGPSTPAEEPQGDVWPLRSRRVEAATGAVRTASHSARMHPFRKLVPVSASARMVHSMGGSYQHACRSKPQGAENLQPLAASFDSRLHPSVFIRTYPPGPFRAVYAGTLD
jgi:hypothetical protein